MDDGRGISVLYVEDEAATREIVGAMLRRRVKTLHLAENGKEGLECFQAHSPDIVITDINMPLMDGLAMAREIKSRDPERPIIVTTAYHDSAHLMKAIDIGIDQYVVKPIEADRLFAALNKCATIALFDRETRRRNEERESLVRELQDALARVKLLSGLLPICSSCKKIRDGQGSWHQLETYIAEHSEAEFTHGLCQECANKLYSKYANGKEPQ